MGYMAYSVFVSHSTRDFRIVSALARVLSQFGIRPFLAEWYLTPGQRLDKKVFREIDTAHCVVVFITQNGLRSTWVQQEIGYAIRAGKPIIPIVEVGIPHQRLGALVGRQFIPFDSMHPAQAVVKAASVVKGMKLKKEEREKTLWVAGAVTAFLLLLSSGSTK
jgi:nucleoside 2-deoxyribosyltransferase